MNALDIQTPDRREIVSAEQASAPMTPMQMAYQLIQNGADLGSVKEMLAMSKELAADQARRAFDNALSAAKAEIPPILKNRKVDFTGKTGLRTNYSHEDLGEIARTVDPILAKHGLSYRFRTEQQDGGAVRVVCVVAHRDGHAEENALQAQRDESGNKNNIQAVGSTITYLQRYTLKAALGLAASNDDDGKAVTVAEKGGAINEAQAATLRALIEETGSDIVKFCGYMGVEAIPDISVSDFPRAVAMLEKKKVAK